MSESRIPAAGRQVNGGVPRRSAAARIYSLLLPEWLFLAGILVLIGLLLVPAKQTIKWVGGTDLEIECVVTDAVTRQPIQGATIQVQSSGDLCGDKDPLQFSLVTDTGGSVKRLYKNCLTCGTSGPNIDTFSVSLPWWLYQVTADGYSPSEWTELRVPENVRQVQRGHPTTKLVVAIRLEKTAAAPNAAPNRTDKK